MKASEMMRSPAVSVAPNCRVISSGILVGIVSEGDFLRRVEPRTGSRSAMDLTETVALMESHHVAPIPVVFEGAVLGMISKAELLAVERKFVQSIHLG